MSSGRKIKVGVEVKMLYQIEMVNNKEVYFTIDLELLEFLETEKGKKLLIMVGLLSPRAFPTHILRDNKVHSRHWTVLRRLKNLKIFGREFQITGMNLDQSDLKPFEFVYSYY